MVGSMITFLLPAYGQNAKAALNENIFSAQPYIYAGADATICNDGAYTVHGSSTFNGIYWYTSGDGIFDDPFSLNTVYTPGVTDIKNGYAILSLGILVDKSIYDEMTLYLNSCAINSQPKR